MPCLLREAYDLSGYDTVMNVTWVGRRAVIARMLEVGNLSRVPHGDHDQRGAGMLRIAKQAALFDAFVDTAVTFI
jgi:hypothetical protein